MRVADRKSQLVITACLVLAAAELHDRKELDDCWQLCDEEGVEPSTADRDESTVVLGPAHDICPRAERGTLARHDNRAQIVQAYESWGFIGLSNELIDLLNIWARFIYGPLLDDRERRIAEDVSPGEYGRREAFTVAKGLKEKGPVKVPREFVFMDRAAIGLGGVFLHLDAKQNWYRLFNETIEGFNLAEVAARQSAAFSETGVPVAR